MAANNPLMARFAGEPTLVEPSLADRFESCLIQAARQHEHSAEMLAETAANDAFWPDEGSWRCAYRPYVVTTDGILQIPVKGVLLNNFPWQDGGWATGYEYIWEAFKRGCADYAIGQVRGIAFVLDTPGGMVAGCFDTVDKMVALKAAVGVPVWAFAHEAAYSAGYAIATAADKIAVSRTGGVGSIGVVTSHVDASGAYEKMGIKLTFIASDPSKVEGNSTTAPSKDFLKRTQARIDELYSIFVAAVVRSRGLDEATIRDELKAYCYSATQALSNGLADSIASLDDATSAFADFLDDQSDNGDDEMTTQVETVEKAVHDKAVSDARAEGHAAGVKEGAVAEQTRIGAILGSEEAKGREAQAQHLAFKTTMSADDAKGILAAAPLPAAAAPEKPAAPAAETPTNFQEAMSRGNPEVGVDGGKPGDQANADDASDVVALATQFGLAGFAAARK